jgi:N-acetylglutamate synthase-like GNAT family acetyltransferase
MDDHIIIRSTEENDRPWMRGVMRKWWGSESVVIRKTKYEPAEMGGFIALHNEEKVGLVILRYNETLCEIMSLTVSGTHPQIGSQLISSAVEDAKKHNSERMIVVTTNDNITALRFYQKMGFRLHELRLGIIEESRKIKPQIPLIGNYHIPIWDEIELEMVL